MATTSAFKFPTGESMNPQAAKAIPSQLVPAPALPAREPLSAHPDWEWGTEVGPLDTLRLRIGDRFVAVSRTDKEHMLYCSAVERRGALMVCRVANGGHSVLFNKNGDSVDFSTPFRIRLLLPKKMFRVPDMDNHEKLLNVVYKQLLSLELIRG